MTQPHTFNNQARAAGPYFYRAFGLRVLSEIPLGELDPIEPCETDLEIRLASVEKRVGDDETSSFFDLAGPELYFGWPGFARFLFRSPSLIEVELDPEGPATLLALPLLGPIMAVLLYKRGYVVLHGSAVALSADGVMFLGDKEAGKSTTAAAMLAGGYELVSDDVVAIDLSTAPPTMLTAYPSLKLTESASAYFAPRDSERLERPFDEFPKDRFKLEHAFASPGARLRFGYVLDRAESLVATPLKGQDALTALLRYSYMVRFGGTFIVGAEAGRHFSQCAALSRAISVFSLTVPSTLERVSEVPPFVARALREAG